MGNSIKLFESFSVKRALPKNLDKEQDIYFKNEYFKNIQASHLWRFRNVLVTKEAVIFKNFRYHKASLTSLRSSIEYGIKYRLLNLVFRSKALKGKKVNLCFNSWYYGYYHWITECLPRFYVANKKSEFSLFFVPEFMESYHRESLQAIGLKESQMISLNNTYKVDNMSLIERLAPSGNYNDAVMNELSKLIKDKLGLVDKKPFRKIYISREKAKTRKVLNEIDIIKEVQQLGFETIYLEDLSFKEQVQLFSESIVVISIHGGGLTNMMFMQPRAKVLEIRKEGDATNLCYYSLANAYDLDYYYLFGQPNDPNKSVQAADLDVSVSELKYIINEFF